MVKNMAFASRLKFLRESKRTVTRHGAAAGIGISYATYCNWEQAKCLPSIDQLPKIASFFGLTVDELLEVETDKVLDEMSSMLASLNDEDRETVKKIMDALILKNTAP